jgi:hypothetical protein
MINCGQVLLKIGVLSLLPARQYAFLLLLGNCGYKLQIWPFLQSRFGSF